MVKNERVELTDAECMEIFRKYDKEIYEYYMKNAYFFGCNARNYARYLKNKHEGGDVK